MMQKREFATMALSYIDYPAVKYKNPFEGSDIEGFDCSGFLNFLLQKAQYPNIIPRHVHELFDTFGILIHEQFRDIGDLVFFSNKNGIYPNHIGIMISQDKYIHSPGQNNKVVCIKKLTQKIIKPKSKTLQIYFSDPIGFKRITINDERYQRIFLS